ncbi:TetR/AcrR family transcriptional regulator [Frankia sp. AgB32]|uniref:TetR/AcrR family transcriptional regulator n=1 Tax=Frankia sp. AgB32 TaxID=631119 RepID=UPI00200EB7C3|nr:TetR/AcrR family transcriptional regulator [Frankia sp. AgB32]MCK9893514.1 TetR/AcrR family transcriptional regulator [Frankia sp. AgB32]
MDDEGFGAPAAGGGRAEPKSRRAPWSGRVPEAATDPDAGTSTPARDKIIDAATVCIRRRGVERSSISTIAAIAGVSRPTVYARFDAREDLIPAALERVGVEISQRVVVTTRRRARSASEFVVEALIAVRREFRAEPALAPIMGVGTEHRNAQEALSAHALAAARPIIAPVVGYNPTLGPHLDEIVETSVRWLLSLLMFDSARTTSEQRLRAYLRRTIVPVIDALAAEPAGESFPDTAT